MGGLGAEHGGDRTAKPVHDPLNGKSLGCAGRWRLFQKALPNLREVFQGDFPYTLSSGGWVLLPHSRQKPGGADVPG